MSSNDTANDAKDVPMGEEGQSAQGHTEDAEQQQVEWIQEQYNKWLLSHFGPTITKRKQCEHIYNILIVVG